MEDFKVRPHKDEKEKKSSMVKWIVLALVLVVAVTLMWWYYETTLNGMDQDASANLMLNLDKIHGLK